MSYAIRPIVADDDAAIERVIRTVMPEFGADGPGFAIHDPEVSAMSEAYSQPGCAYFVVELDGRVAGGGGVAPLPNADADICELKKMYFLTELRGRGAGRELMRHCLDNAHALGYRRCYLETLSSMGGARRLYIASGFRAIPQSLGSTGHFGCDRFFIRDL